MQSILTAQDAPNTTRAYLLNMQTNAERVLNDMRSACCDNFQKFWFGSEPVEKQLLELGTAAANWFAQHARTVEYLLTSGVEMDPAEYTPPRAFTIHQDGTITLD